MHEVQAIHKEAMEFVSNSLAIVCKKLRKKGDANIDSFKKPWEDLSHFQEIWKTQIHQHQSRYIATTSFTKERKVWLEYLFKENNSSMSAFRCRFCHIYFQNKKLNNKKMP